MAGVTGGLDDHVQDDLPDVAQPPIAEEVRPPGRGRVKRRRRDDGIRPLNLLAVQAEHRVGRYIRPDLPGVVRA